MSDFKINTDPFVFLNSPQFPCAIILAAEILEMTERPSNSSCLAIAPFIDGLSVICKKTSRIIVLEYPFGWEKKVSRLISRLMVN